MQGMCQLCEQGDTTPFMGYYGNVIKGRPYEQKRVG